MPDLSYGGTIGYVEDAKSGISIGEIGIGTDHVDTACLSRRVMMIHDRRRCWTGYVDDFEPPVPMGEVGMGAGNGNGLRACRAVITTQPSRRGRVRDIDNNQAGIVGNPCQVSRRVLDSDALRAVFHLVESRLYGDRRIGNVENRETCLVLFVLFEADDIGILVGCEYAVGDARHIVVSDVFGLQRIRYIDESETTRAVAVRDQGQRSHHMNVLRDGLRFQGRNGGLRCVQGEGNQLSSPPPPWTPPPKNHALPMHFPFDIFKILLYYYIMRGRPKKQEVQMVPLPVYLPEDVHKDLRHAAIDEGRSATDIIRELVSGWLVIRKRKKGGK